MAKFLLIVVCVFCGSIAAADGPAASLSAAAREFLASLDEDRRAGVSFDLEDDARATWSNLPTLMAPPVGIFLKELNDAQRLLVHQMLKASLSSRGYAKTVAIMWLDDLLKETENARLEQSPEARANPWRWRWRPIEIRETTPSPYSVYLRTKTGVGKSPDIIWR